MIANVSASRFTRTTPRNVVVRDSTRVFTDAEWDQALSRAASLYREGDAPAASTSGGSEMPAEGRVFADSTWEEAMKKAPLLLKELDRVEEIARTPEAVDGGSESASTEGRVFTPEQWDAAIQIAVATEKALADKVWPHVLTVCRLRCCTDTGLCHMGPQCLYRLSSPVRHKLRQLTLRRCRPTLTPRLSHSRCRQQKLYLRQFLSNLQWQVCRYFNHL